MSDEIVSITFQYEGKRLLLPTGSRANAIGAIRILAMVGIPAALATPKQNKQYERGEIGGPVTFVCGFATVELPSQDVTQ